MKISYRNNVLERVLIGTKGVTSLAVVGSFALSFGFYEPPVPLSIVMHVQVVLLAIFLAGKTLRLLNAESRREYLFANWYEVPLLLALALVLAGAGRWFGWADPSGLQHFAIAIYLLTDVTIKFFMLSVSLAAAGRNPTKTLVAIFMVLIVIGASLLMLPKATPGRDSLRFVDALFTATSATCVTGLTVKNTGQDFTFLGQVVILVLIQLGGLGIMVFGAVLALLLRQAFSLRESVALQDLVSAQTLGRIGNIILFIFVVTVMVEAVGALALFGMWNTLPGWEAAGHSRWFYSIFHSISAFCNAGFSLLDGNLVRCSRNWQVYGIICPLILLGGLGFGVLHNLANVVFDRVCLLGHRCLCRPRTLAVEPPARLNLQSRIVLRATATLVVAGALALFFFEHYAARSDAPARMGILDAFFQSVTARTAGFNTMPIEELSESSKLVLILLMFVGGSPGGTAGGVKTVTVVIIVMAVLAMLRKRSEVEVLRRSIRNIIVDRAVTIVTLYVLVLLVATLALNVTESQYRQHFTLVDMMFEAASALGTVGLSTGITPTLTDAGKVIIIAVMLIGRLGPLTLVAALTFNTKPARYDYPDEAVIVG